MSRRTQRVAMAVVASCAGVAVAMATRAGSPPASDGSVGPRARAVAAAIARQEEAWG